MRRFFHVILFIILCISPACRTVYPTVGGTHERDSISGHIETRHDSIYIDRWHDIRTSGDTVFVHDSVYVDRYHKIYEKDSIEVVLRDTIYQEPEIIEKPISRGNRFLINSGIALWILAGILIIVVGVVIILKIKK